MGSAAAELAQYAGDAMSTPLYISKPMTAYEYRKKLMIASSFIDSGTISAMSWIASAAGCALALFLFGLFRCGGKEGKCQ